MKPYNNEFEEDEYDPEANTRAMEAFENNQPSIFDDQFVDDPLWGYRRKSWLQKRNKEYRKAFEGETFDTYDYSFGGKASGFETTAYSDYTKTGDWKGYNYYQKSTVDYRYIEQMANIFSTQHNIIVRPSDTWRIDLKEKVLEYNPTSLMFGTKAEVVASLLHEIGHLRHTTELEKIKRGKYLSKSCNSAFEVLNCFEDFRIDDIMKKSYAGAEDIFESNKGTVQQLISLYETRKIQDRDNVLSNLSSLLYTIGECRADIEIGTYEQGQLEKSLNNKFSLNDPETIKKANELITCPYEECDKRVADLKQEIKNEPTLRDYMIGIIVEAYQLPVKGLPTSVVLAVKNTKEAISKSIKAKDTQTVADILESEVYPHIENLLKQQSSGSPEIEKTFGSETAKYFAPIYVEDDGSERNSYRGIETRTGIGNIMDKIPQEWMFGDYDALKESVESAIKELIRKLQVLKQEDTSLKWASNLKRGRIDTKAIYRYPSGRFDFFKKKRIAEDRTRNFAFSLVIDVSGSMGGMKAINATRGIIILSEVFSHFNIPFEIITFGYRATHIKTFDTQIDKEIKERIGDCVKADEGSTHVNLAYEEAEIGDRPEKNKYIVVLTDGQSANVKKAKESYEYLTHKGVKGIGMDILSKNEYGNYSSQIMGAENIKIIRDANTIPTAFEELLKKIIKVADNKKRYGI